MHRHPPLAAVRLLRACLGDDAFEVVAGDLDEEFARGRGAWWYWRQVVRSVVSHGIGRARRHVSAGAGDLRYAVRSLRRQPRLAVVAVATLGFGIALSVSALTALNAYLLRGMPYPESDRLHTVSIFRPGVDFRPGLEKLDWASLDDLMEVQIAWDLDLFNLRGEPYAEAASGTWVTPGYLEGFGIRPAIGRSFQPADFEPGAPAVAVISHRLWQTRFGADPAIVGRRFESYSNDRPDDIGVFTILGVLPEHFWHYQAFTDVLAPLRSTPTYPYVVRLRPGVDPAVAATRVTALVRAGTEMPDGWQAELPSFQASYVESVRPLLLTFGTAAGLVLLIAAANVGVLLLIRANEREREIAVRKALGATWTRLARALCAEAVVLGALAVTLGLGLAQLAVAAVAPIADRSFGRAAPGGASALALDGFVLTGALVAGFAVVFLCSLGPIWSAARASTGSAASSGQKGASSGRAQQRARMTLVVIEVGACFALIVSAALMVQSAIRMLETDIGVDVRDIQVTRLSVPVATYPDAAARAGLLDRVALAAADLPGLAGIAFVNAWPLQGSVAYEVTGDARNEAVRAEVRGVSATYFDVVDLRILEGRAFGVLDRPESGRTAIASRTLASRLWPDQTAVGRRLTVPPAPGSPAGTPPLTLEIVGVVEDARHSHLDDDRADLYLALSQVGSAAPFVYLKTADATGAFNGFRAALARVDPGIVTTSVRPLADILDQQRSAARFLAQLLVVFAALSAVLALVGVHGVIAYAAGRRRREIAVRTAIGASRGAIVRLFVRQGVAMVGAGIVIGLAGAIALGRLLESQLFGVNAADVRVLGLTAVAFGLCGLLASAGPARRAAAVDPADALKDA